MVDPLPAIELVEAFSKRLHTYSWLWGGLTVDVYRGELLREHDDLDYLTLNLHTLMPAVISQSERRGWQTKVLENGDLQLKWQETKIHLGHVEISHQACWTHNGAKGRLWFPREWLPPEGRGFCGRRVHVVAPEFQLVLLERPELLNPNWKCRHKDLIALDYLRHYFENMGIKPESLLTCVRDFCEMPTRQIPCREEP